MIPGRPVVWFPMSGDHEGRVEVYNQRYGTGRWYSAESFIDHLAARWMEIALGIARQWSKKAHLLLTENIRPVPTRDRSGWVEYACDGTPYASYEDAKKASLKLEGHDRVDFSMLGGVLKRIEFQCSVEEIERRNERHARFCDECRLR